MRPVVEALDAMPARGEPVARRLADPPFEGEQSGMGGMGREGVGMAVGDEAGRLDRILQRHAEDQMVEEHLQVRLDLGVPAGGAERHDPAPRRQDEARVRGEPGALAGGDAGRMPAHRPGLGAARRHREPGPGHHRGVPARIGRGRAQGVPLPVDHADDRGVGRWPERRLARGPRCGPRYGDGDR